MLNSNQSGVYDEQDFHKESQSLRDDNPPINLNHIYSDYPQPTEKKSNRLYNFFFLVFFILLVVILVLLSNITVAVKYDNNTLKIKESNTPETDASETSKKEDDDPETIQQKLEQLQNMVQMINKDVSIKKQVKKQYQTMSQQIQSAILSNLNQIAQQIKSISSNLKNQEDHEVTKGAQPFKKVDPNYVFKIPKNVWAFKEDSSWYLKKLYTENWQSLSRQSGFFIQFVNYDSINDFLPKQVGNQLKRMIQILGTKGGGQSLHVIAKRLILLNFLNQYGGIMIDGSLAFTQTFTWIENITRNNLVQRANRATILPQIICFYRQAFSSQKARFDIDYYDQIEEVDKQIIQYPALQDNFVVSVRKSKFVQDWIAKIYNLVENFDKIPEYKEKYGLTSPKNGDLLKQLPYIGYFMTLKEKQDEIDKVHNKKKHFALDYYGMNFINSYYGPYKGQLLSQVFLSSKSQYKFAWNSFYDMAHYSYQNYQELNGPHKYIIQLNSRYSNYNNIEREKQIIGLPVFKGSFLQRVFYNELDSPFLILNKEKPTTYENDQQWSIPRFVWVYQSEGVTKSPILSQLSFQNIKRLGQLSGFQVNKVDSANIKNFLDEGLVDQIEKSAKTSNQKHKNITLSYIYGLSLLHEYGGILVDQSTILLDNFTWVLNISNISSENVFNRYEEYPKVLMIQSPNNGDRGVWQYQTLTNNNIAKIKLNQTYQPRLVVSQSGTQFIKDWVAMLVQTITLPDDKIEQMFRKYGVQKEWIQNSYQYLSNTAQCTLAKQGMELQKQQWLNAAEYYGFWTLNSYYSPISFAERKDNKQIDSIFDAIVFKYSIDQVQQIVGKHHYGLSLLGKTGQEVEKLVKQHINGNFTDITHSKSIFRQFIWNQKYSWKENQGKWELQTVQSKK